MLTLVTAPDSKGVGIAPTLSPLYREVEHAYRAMPMAREDYATFSAYVALCKELRAQFGIVRAYVDVTFSPDDPYPNSRAMFNDIEQYRSLRVFTGGEPIAACHLFGSPAYIDGYPGLTFNHVFRAVHDALAHYPERNSFGVTGEFRAFQAHARLLTPLAVKALATETLGQNAFYALNKAYAPQKFALLPDTLIDSALERSL
jgi:hypothetical protein